MEKDKINMRKGVIGMLILLISMFSCQPEIIPDDIDPNDELNDNSGIVNFNFQIPEQRVPLENIHRIDLSIAVDAKSLYSGYFLKSANVSDIQVNYSFDLEDGEYYYQAGITCSSKGDTCLWDGFPGGQWGTKWTSGKIEIVKGQTIYKNLTFNN